MKEVLLLGAGSLFAALALFACSDSGGDSGAPPSDDAGVDAIDDARGDVRTPLEEADAACSECAWFPESCSKGALCAATVEALDPRVVLFALDVHDEEVTAVGTYGSVVERSAGAWRRVTVGSPDPLRGIARLGGEAWAAASVGGVFVRQAGQGNTAWTGHRPGPDYYGRNMAVTGLFAEPAGTWVWASTATTCAPSSGSDGVGLVRLRKQADDSGWLDLQTVIQHQEPMSLCITMNALDGSGGALWVAGEKGVLYEVTELEASPPTVTPVSSGTTSSLLGVWAEATGHVFAVGKDGTVQHRPPGGAFASLGEGVPRVAYHAVRGTSATDVWIAGEDATVMHYDGKRWTRVPIAGLGDRRPTLRAIAAIAPDRIWVAGDNVLLGLAREDGSAP